MTSTTDHRPKPLTRTRRLVAIIAGAALGVTGAVAVGSAQDDAPAATTCPPTEADLLRAADAARRLEAQRPDLFAQVNRPADYDDLRLAAEWARRLAVLDPSRADCTRTP
jgi:hypothetical protein